MSRARKIRLVRSLLTGGLLALAATCSLQNQEGPNVTCADLQCGVVNACADGIIAQCADGYTVLYHVCAAGDDSVCDEDWQTPGQYRCDEFQTVCEGCNPSRPGCANPGGAGPGGGGAGGGGGAAPGGAGGGGAAHGGAGGDGAGGGGAGPGGGGAGPGGGGAAPGGAGGGGSG
jgi:hypothetical protein